MKAQRMLSWINLILFAGVLAVNALANILPINGYQTGELSDMLPNLFVPAGVTFSIWGVIYLFLTAFCIVNLIDTRKDPAFPARYQMLWGINFILNMLWILAWHYRILPLTLLIMLGLFASLLLLARWTEGSFPEDSGRRFLHAWTVGIYFGWISVALIANITAFLVYLGWRGGPLSESFWTMAVISAGTLIAVLRTWIQRDYPFALVFLWAYSGILIKRYGHSHPERGIILTAWISLGIIAAVVLARLVASRMSSQKEKTDPSE